MLRRITSKEPSNIAAPSATSAPKKRAQVNVASEGFERVRTERPELKKIAAKRPEITVPRVDHPRPHFHQPDLGRVQLLNGRWDFELGDAGKFDRSIEVPYPPQSPLGLDDPNIPPTIQYRRTFDVPADWLKDGSEVLIHFNRVDQECRIFVNGHEVEGHVGQAPFSREIAQHLRPGSNEIVVRVEDTNDPSRFGVGKQPPYEKAKDGSWDFSRAGVPKGVDYLQVSGIIGDVFLEQVPKTRVSSVRANPLGGGELELSVKLNQPAPGKELRIDIKENDEVVRSLVHVCKEGETDVLLKTKLDDVKYWYPAPNLYGLEIKLQDPKADAPEHHVRSRFGYRTIACRDGNIEVNGKPVALVGTLYQPWFVDGLTYAPPEAQKKDAELLAQLGNYHRYHKVLPDPRFLDEADRLGFLTSLEPLSAREFTPESADRVRREQLEALELVANSPSLSILIATNEAWGYTNFEDPAQYQAMMRHTLDLLAADPMRLVISDSGWKMLKPTALGDAVRAPANLGEGATRVPLAVHNYLHRLPEILEHVRRGKGRLPERGWCGEPAFVAPKGDQSDPYGGTIPTIMTDEIGGTCTPDEDNRNDLAFAYNAVATPEAHAKKTEEILKGFVAAKMKHLTLTQFSDQTFPGIGDGGEQNGLVLMNREPKPSFPRIARSLRRAQRDLERIANGKEPKYAEYRRLAREPEDAWVKAAIEKIDGGAGYQHVRELATDTKGDALAASKRLDMLAFHLGTSTIALLLHAFTEGPNDIHRLRAAESGCALDRLPRSQRQLLSRAAELVERTRPWNGHDFAEVIRAIEGNGRTSRSTMQSNKKLLAIVAEEHRWDAAELLARAAAHSTLDRGHDVSQTIDQMVALDSVEKKKLSIRYRAILDELMRAREEEAKLKRSAEAV